MSLPRTPSGRLDGRRALVTGAGRGIGLAAAAALAEAGAQVVLTARSAPEIEAAVASIQAAGGKATAVPVDVTDLAAMRQAVAAHGPFHILVNNAGGSAHQPFLEVTEDAFDAVMALNVRAAFFCAQAVAQGMAAAGIAGSIVNVSSQMGLVGGPRRSVYAATKHAMEGFTKAAAIELGPLGIRINTLCPTFIETPMTRPFFEADAFREWVGRNIHMGRVGQVEDLMAAIVFLAGDGSAMMTGSALVVDGGWTAA